MRKAIVRSSFAATLAVMTAAFVPSALRVPQPRGLESEV